MTEANYSNILLEIQGAQYILTNAQWNGNNFSGNIGQLTLNATYEGSGEFIGNANGQQYGGEIEGFGKNVTGWYVPENQVLPN